MHFALDGSGIGLGGLILAMMAVMLVLSMIRYNNVTRPNQERRLTEAREAEERERRAIHENDVPQ